MNDNRNNLEQLAYLGMRIALRERIPAAELREHAFRSIDAKLRFAAEWERGDAFPTLMFHHAEALDRRGAIIAVPHTGAYHRIPLALTEHVGVTLLLDADNFVVEKCGWTRWAERYTGSVDDPIEYIDVTRPTAGWHAVRAAREGRMVVVYLDGNTGFSPASAATTVDVNFCDTTLSVRRGIATLSAAAAVPVIPVYAKRHSGIDHIFVDSPTQGSARQIMQACYNLLNRLVMEDIASWEEWYHLERWHVVDTVHDCDLHADAPLTADAHVDLLQLTEGPTLVHLRTGAAILATDNVLAIMQQAAAGFTPTMIAGHEEDVLSTLLQLAAFGFVRTAESLDTR